jgi:hypothetical protein
VGMRLIRRVQRVAHQLPSMKPAKRCTSVIKAELATALGGSVVCRMSKRTTTTAIPGKLKMQRLLMYIQPQ